MKKNVIRFWILILVGVSVAPTFSQIISTQVSDECVSLRIETKCSETSLDLDSLKLLQMSANEVGIVINSITDNNRTCKKYEIFLCPPENIEDGQVQLMPTIDTSQGCPFIDEFGELRLCDVKDEAVQDFLQICHIQTNEDIEVFICSSLTFNTLFTCNTRCLSDMCLIYLSTGERVLGDCSWFKYELLEGFTRKPVIDLSKEIIRIK